MHAVIEQLLTRAPVITDGGWGTSFQAAGLAPGQCPEEWNLSKPERVVEIARGYVDAGSEIILTNSFNGTRLRLDLHDLGDRVAEINATSVELSRRAAGDKALIFASVGPSGAMLCAGTHTPEQVHEAFAEQCRALADANTDGLLVESFSDLEEAEIAVAEAARTGLPVVASMVFDTGDDFGYTMMGQTPEQCAKALHAAGADIVGSNCGKAPKSFIDTCKRLHAASDRPVWIKPNAGIPELIGDETIFHQTPEAFAQEALPLLEAGAGFIGGCCGTQADFIQALHNAVKG